MLIEGNHQIQWLTRKMCLLLLPLESQSPKDINLCVPFHNFPCILTKIPILYIRSIFYLYKINVQIHLYIITVANKMYIGIYKSMLYVYTYRNEHNGLFSDFCKQKWHHAK